MSRINPKNIILILLLIIIHNVRTDVPAHCTLQQIAGEWVFRINKAKFNPGLNQETSCGHGLPDHIDNTIGDKDYEFDSYIDIKITLGKDNKVYENKQVVGNWTSIYVEGFILNYKESQFSTLMKYFRLKKTKTYTSNCDKTMIGWYINDVKRKLENWSCFFGFKAKSISSPSNFLQVNKIKPKETLFYQRTPALLLQLNPLLNKIMYEDQKDLVDEINSQNLTWEAHINPQFVGLSLFQLQESYGGSSNFVRIKDGLSQEKKKIVETNFISKKIGVQKHKDSHEVTDYKEVIKYINSDIEEIPSETLPLNWDWRNIGGINYVTEPRMQGSCGSCYVFATLASLESRLRIKTNNKDKTEFSRNFILSCSFYSQGCKGGYPIEVAKFSNEFELIPESCFEYNTSNIDCNSKCDYTKFEKKYTVDKYGYLGGYYGATSEEMMMKELRARGPIPGNYYVPGDFHYYKKGIYSKYNPLKGNKNISKYTMRSRNKEWEEVAHSVVIVGWGEENNVKYWICMNSWGKHFGEKGFFRILRGVDECNIESMGDFMDIKVENRK